MLGPIDIFFTWLQTRYGARRRSGQAEWAQAWMVKRTHNSGGTAAARVLSCSRFGLAGHALLKNGINLHSAGCFGRFDGKKYLFRLEQHSFARSDSRDRFLTIEKWCP
jgi:hypothetical protein